MGGALLLLLLVMSETPESSNTMSSVETAASRVGQLSVTGLWCKGGEGRGGDVSILMKVVKGGEGELRKKSYLTEVTASMMLTSSSQ